MTLLLMMTTLITLMSSMILASSPLALGLTILLAALFTSLVFCSLASSWLAFLIFLIYVGGMLIMFSYFVALTPNQPSLSNYTYMIMPLFIMFSFMPYTMNLKPLFNTFSSFAVESLLTLMNSSIIILLALILLLTMVIVVKITALTKGPLRAFMAYV